MSHIQRNLRRAALAGIAAFGLTSVAFAQTASPSTGLGQSWPNATDVSASPQWHVYVFVLNGIKYVQINDLNGNVHAAVGTANGASVVLPAGLDAQNVSTTSSSATPSNTQTVYSDSTTTVTATPQSNGTTQFTVLDACTNPYTCSTFTRSGGGG